MVPSTRNGRKELDEKPHQYSLPVQAFKPWEKRAAWRHPGFTLVELMIVLTILSILVSMAIPIATGAIQKSKEAVLKSNLHTLRMLIDQYTADKLKAPQSLQDLVSAGYLREIPKDPITNSSESWEIEMGDSLQFPDQTETGIVDIHSGSTTISSEGTAYNEW